MKLQERDFKWLTVMPRGPGSSCLDVLRAVLCPDLAHSSCLRLIVNNPGLGRAIFNGNGTGQVSEGPPSWARKPM